MGSSFQTFWQEREPRERLLLAVMAVVLAITALYVFLLEPAAKATARLRQELPELRAQVESMRAQKGEVARLRALPKGAALPVGELRTLVQNSAKAAGVGTEFARLEVGSGGLVQVNLTEVPFDAWMRWVDVLHREHHIGVDSARVEVAGNPGAVRVEAVLAAPQ